jgi:hypothetical protein
VSMAHPMELRSDISDLIFHSDDDLWGEWNAIKAWMLLRV